MYQTSSNTFHSQQHILAEWGEQCGGYINQLSKYSMSVSLCPCVCVCVCYRHWRVQRQTVPQQRDMRTRCWRFHLCVWTGLHWCPVWDRWAEFFTLQGKVGISLQRKYFLQLSASNSVTLADVFAQRVSPSTYTNGSRLRLWLNSFANNSSFFVFGHTMQQWTTVRKFTEVRSVSFTDLAPPVIDCWWNLNPLGNSIIRLCTVHESLYLHETGLLLIPDTWSMKLDAFRREVQCS